MAVITPTWEYFEDGTAIVEYELAHGDVGEYISLYMWDGKTEQKTGNGSIVWQGTNDLTGTVIAPALQSKPRFVRPSYAGSDQGLTIINVFLTKD